MTDAAVSIMARCGAPGDQRGNDAAADSAAVRADMANVFLPPYDKVDDYVDRAHQLRARYIGVVLKRAWSALRNTLVSQG
jgi:hypothetical protein